MVFLFDTKFLNYFFFITFLLKKKLKSLGNNLQFKMNTNTCLRVWQLKMIDTREHAKAALCHRTYTHAQYNAHMHKAKHEIKQSKRIGDIVFNGDKLRDEKGKMKNAKTWLRLCTWQFSDVLWYPVVSCHITRSTYKPAITICNVLTLSQISIYFHRTDCLDLWFFLHLHSLYFNLNILVLTTVSNIFFIFHFSISIIT